MTEYILRRVHHKDNGTETYTYLCDIQGELTTNKNFFHPSLLRFRNFEAAVTMQQTLQRWLYELYNQNGLECRFLWQVRSMNDEQKAFYLSQVRTYPGYRGEGGYYEAPHEIEPNDEGNENDIPF